MNIDVIVKMINSKCQEYFIMTQTLSQVEQGIKKLTYHIFSNKCLDAYLQFPLKGGGTLDQGRSLLRNFKLKLIPLWLKLRKL